MEYILLLNHREEVSEEMINFFKEKSITIRRKERLYPDTGVIQEGEEDEIINEMGIERDVIETVKYMFLK